MKKILPIAFVLILNSFSLFAQNNLTEKYSSVPILNANHDSIFLKQFSLTQNQSKQKNSRIESKKADSTITFFWHASNVWMKAHKYVDTYDTSGNLVFEKIFIGDTIGWKNNSQSNFTYDNNNNLVEALIEIWNGVSYENNSLITYTYDGNGNWVYGEYKGWDYDSHHWALYEKINLSYNSNNERTHVLTKSYMGNNIQEQYSYFLTYDNSGNLDSQIEVDSNSNGWQNYYKYIFTYYADNKMASVNEGDWNSTYWNLEYITNFTYDNQGNLILIFFRDTESIGNSSQYFTYDNYGNQLSYMRQDSDGVNIFNVYRSFFYYDIHRNMVSGLFQIAPTNTYWSNHDSVQLFYTYNGVIKEEDTTQSEISLSPNPSTTEIKITNLSPTENQISLFSLLGQQVKSIRVSHVQSTILPVSDLPAGIYVVTIFDGEKIVCKKFVRE